MITIIHDEKYSFWEEKEITAACPTNTNRTYNCGRYKQFRQSRFSEILGTAKDSDIANFCEVDQVEQKYHRFEGKKKLYQINSSSYPPQKKNIAVGYKKI